MPSEVLQKEEKSSQIRSPTRTGQAGQDRTGTANRTRTLLEPVLRTRPPVGEEGEQVIGADEAIIIKISRVTGIWTPIA